MTFIPASPKTLFLAKSFQRISSITAMISMTYFFLFNSKEFLESALGLQSILKDFPLPTMESNSYININELSFIKREIFNFLFIALFCGQHMVLARGWFKDFMKKINIYYVFFERSIFNFLASVFLFTGMLFHQPSEEILLDFSNKYTDFVMIFLLFIHVLLELWAFHDMKDADIMGFALVKLFEENKGTHIPIHFKQKPPSLLSNLMRHPLYYCAFAHLWLATTKITTSRMIWNIILSVFILVGTHFEEKEIIRKHPDYLDYIKRVPNKYMPNLGIFFKKKNN